MNKSKIKEQLEKLQVKANRLKQELQAKFPDGYPNTPWPGWLKEKQGELWMLGYKIIRLKEVLNG